MQIHFKGFAVCLRKLQSLLFDVMRQNIRALIFGLFLCPVMLGSAGAQDGGTWQLGAPMPVSRQELATGALNGRVYVLGGYDENGVSTATVEDVHQIGRAHV